MRGCRERTRARDEMVWRSWTLANQTRFASAVLTEKHPDVAPATVRRRVQRSPNVAANCQIATVARRPGADCGERHDDGSVTIITNKADRCERTRAVCDEVGHGHREVQEFMILAGRCDAEATGQRRRPEDYALILSQNR